MWSTQSKTDVLIKNLWVFFAEPGWKIRWFLQQTRCANGRLLKTRGTSVHFFFVSKEIGQTWNT